ncbi:MAG: beta-ketoacyl-ACP synthase [Zoogloeaceae bacterium]|jgi:3-oxoacyl-[acyl-carrier-protein] synthase-1|nr:beta-ketoacyl-ACP synthase [Zoogloeaceae bacterium]
MNFDCAAYLHPPGILCALGDALPEISGRLFAGSAPGMRVTEAYSPGSPLLLGEVAADLPELAVFPEMDRSRNNALLLAAFARIEADYCRLAAGLPKRRVAIVIGSSTSGIFESENAVRHLESAGFWPSGFRYEQQELGSPSQALARQLGIQGAAWTVSTACTSGAKALISGARLLKADLADLVIAGGVDTLARFTVAGFSALGAVSPSRCLPFSANRCGINIGEAAALFLMTREAPAQSAAIRLSGWGESSDGYHISAPDPAGRGALRAIRAALREAKLAPEAIGYVNLHGTATAQNDAMEAKVMAEIFPPNTPMSSTKPLTGHTLGASGALEAGLCWLVLADHDRRLPPHVWDGRPDQELPPLGLVAPGITAPSSLRSVLSTSFAFGGSNVALILEREF